MIVSVIIVTTGEAEHIISCLDSLKAQAFSPLEVVVIDNSLRPSFRKEIVVRFPWVKVYSSPNNFSYGISMNMGISMSKGDFILCLNDDVVLDRYFIQEALNGFSVDAKIAMVSGKICRIETKTIDSAGLFLSLSRVAKERGYGLKDTGQYGKPGYIFGVSGAAAFYHKQMMEDIKQGTDCFDPDFRFFYEDLDIAWRARNRGWKAYYVPTAIAYHARGGTARKKQGVGKVFARFYINDDDLQFELIKNRCLAIIKNDTALGFLLHLPFIFIYSLAELGFLVLFRPKVIPKLLSLPRFMKSAFRKRFAAERI
ncbi:MAG: glycosyltransferase [Candidatus Omnitrophica bacterium]|nr:glycosyltransferase [Candidatus Omnitrophota bacterium]